MSSVYIVVENGEPYLQAYKTFEDAANDVRIKYKRQIEEENEWCMNSGIEGCNIVYDPESSTETTYYYIEKGISIYIYKVPIKG